MLKAVKIFQRIKTILIVALVIAVALFLFMLVTVNTLGDYVQKNYIVVNKHSRVQGKQAFVREYTIATGDDTLAKIAGVDVFDERSVVFNTSDLEWGDTDYRDVVKHIAGTWIQQGRYSKQNLVSSLYEEAISKFTVDDREIPYTDASFKTKFGDIGPGTNTGLYVKSGTQTTYNYETKSQKFSITSLRCCCCLAESFCEYLSIFDTEGFKYDDEKAGHTGSIGVSKTASAFTASNTYINSEGEKETSRTYFTTNIASPTDAIVRFIGDDLRKDIVSKGLTNATLRELKESGYLKPGMIVTYISKDDHAYNEGKKDIPAACRHIEIITYIDGNYVYTAGASDDQDIFMNAVVGYNSIVSLDKTIFVGLDSACSGVYTGNIILWNESKGIVK